MVQAGGSTTASVPLILSGPGVRSRQVDSDAAQLEDVAPTVLSDMGVKPTGMEGHVLTGALVDPTATTERIRKQEIQRLDPVTTALSSLDSQNVGG